jgi:hypothetical protein
MESVKKRCKVTAPKTRVEDNESKSVTVSVHFKLQ